MMMCNAYDDIVLPIRVLFACAFNVCLEFLDGFIEGNFVIKALDLKSVL
jgi:hypothetical protein